MSGNYDRVCRLCLSSRGELLPIFPTTSSDDSEPPVLASKIKDCVSVQINENDDLPTNVCRKCADNVNNWHIFKAVCERTQIKLQSLRDGSQLEEIQVKSEPYSDEAYDDGVVIDGSYPENAATKVQPEGPPILASLGLTPRSDKGADSDKEEEEDEEDLNDTSVFPKIPNIPEVSITVMRPTGETLQSKQGIHQLASKDCLVCGRSYRYSHNARRHELNSHGFDRYTNKVTPKKTHSDRMQPKLRPNPFNPKARLMPNPVNQKMQFMTQNNPHKMMARSKVVTPSRPIPIKTVKSSNVLPYPLRIKALKDLQIKKKEPQILKTLLTSKPEVLVSEPEILNSGPESPETLISEPEIASFQVETILSEPDVYGPAQDDDEEDGEMHNNQSQNYDTVEMDSENEIEIARQQTNEDKGEGQDEGEEEENGDREQERPEGHENDDKDRDNENNDDTTESQHNDMDENINIKAENDTKDGEEEDAGNEERDNEENDNEDNMHEGNEDDDDEELHMSLAPVVEINEDLQNNADFSKDGNEENEEDEELEETVDPNDTVDDEPSKELDPDKTYITKTQRDFILKYRDVIEQINTMRCLCCDREHPRRKAVIQHLQKNGQRVPKHTCYNCVITFGHIGALLSHMRANACTDVWKIIYNENGITDDLVLENEPKEDKSQYKDILSARSYACKMCPAKFNLKQFIMRHVLEVHEDGQSRVPLVCVHCRNRFKDKNLLKKHIRKGDCMVYISCDLCSEKFINLQDFNDHALAVHAGSFDPENQSKCVDGRPTDCPLCGKKNNNYPNLVKHLKIIHNEEKPHYCQHCDAKFEQTPELNKHIYMEHSDRSLGVSEPDMSLIKDEAEEYHYSCTECNAIFETVDAWTDHQVAEHNQVAHHCDQCEKKFLRPSELAEHKNTHLRVKFYPCNGCPNSYSSPVKLAEHMQQVHPGMAPTPNDMEFFCDICVRSFKSRQAYSNHMRIHAKIPTTNRKPTENKGFAPQIIGKPIKQMPVVQQPSFVYKPNTNVPNAPYSCDICGKGFMHKKNIWKHKKVLHADLLNDRNDSEENTMHASTEEEEFNPEENGAILSTPQFNSFNFSSFTNNIPQAQTPPTPTVSTTVTEMPYSCELCYKRFPLRTSLWKHKRAKHGIVSNNTNEMQPQQVSDGSSSRSSCTICKITFSDKKSYYRHRKNVHKSTVQMCKICGKPLNSTLELYEHLKAAHARELLGYNATQGPSKPQPEVSQDLEPEYDNEPEAVDPNDYQARYPCDTCGKQFVGLLALQNHQCINQMQSQPQTFDCEICHKSYSSISALKSHRGWHLRSPDGKAAANNSGLWMPQHKVTSKISKHEILDPSQLARVTHTTTTPPPPVAPPSAAVAKRRLPPEVEVTVVNPNKKLRSDDSIDLDQQNCALDDRYCTICDKEFTKRAAYQRHMDEVHQPNSVFCPVCDKSFTRKSTLLIHMKKHYESGEGSSSLAQTEQEEENHSCDVCGLQFDTEQGMLTHKAMNHGDESEAEESEDDGNVPIAQPGEFTCGQCGDGVATPRDLIAHRSMHATPTKFFCNICKVYFSRALDLSSHTRARHADNEKVFFPCAMCDRFYMNKKSLQRHIEMVH